MEFINRFGRLSMKNRQFILEHGDMMVYSRELMELRVPKEVNFVFYVIIALVITILMLLSVVKINDVVKANGIVKTESNTSSIMNIIPGKISGIYYKPDQFVAEGEVLYSLSDDVYLSLKTDLLKQLENNQEKLLCDELLLESIAAGKNIVETSNHYVYSQLEDYLKNLAYMQQQVEILKFRYEKELNQPEILQNKLAVDEAALNFNLSQAEMEKYKASFKAEVMQRKKALELEENQIIGQLARTEDQYAYLNVRAPVSGFVQEISSLNVGDYIFANQKVLNIIPNDEKSFRVELSVPTKSIGEIVPGMEVKLRLSAFPFFEYKGAVGKIVAIDSDVRQTSNGSLYYCVYSDIDRVIFKSKRGIEYPLKPGIEVNARIVMEKISLMNYILRKLDFIK